MTSSRAAQSLPAGLNLVVGVDRRCDAGDATMMLTITMTTRADLPNSTILFALRDPLRELLASLSAAGMRAMCPGQL